MGITSPRYRKDQCVHEAGHAVAWWFFGHRVDSVEVVPLNRKKPWAPGGSVPMLGQFKGPPIVFERLPSEMGFEDGELRAWYDARGVTRAEIQLVVIAAGPVAEAEQTRRKENAIWCFGGGASDYAFAKAVAARWLDRDPEAAINEAIARAKALLRSDRGRRAVSALARGLAKSAFLDEGAINAICSGAFDGLEPAFQGWTEAWPPKIGDLRAGRVITRIGTEEVEAVGGRIDRTASSG